MGRQVVSISWQNRRWGKVVVLEIQRCHLLLRRRRHRSRRHRPDHQRRLAVAAFPHVHAPSRLRLRHPPGDAPRPLLLPRIASGRRRIRRREDRREWEEDDDGGGSNVVSYVYVGNALYGTETPLPSSARRWRRCVGGGARRRSSHRALRSSRLFTPFICHIFCREIC